MAMPLGAADDTYDLGLFLTVPTVAVIDLLVSYENLLLVCTPFDPSTPEDLALSWVVRWGRRRDKRIIFPHRFGPGSEPMTVTVDGALWQTLRGWGRPQGMRPDEVSSAVVNAWGGHMAWKESDLMPE